MKNYELRIKNCSWIVIILLALFLLGCASADQFFEGVDLFIQFVDFVMPDHYVIAGINIEKTDNLRFFVIGNNRYSIRTDIVNNFTKRGFNALPALDIESARNHIETHKTLYDINDKFYIIKYSYTTTNDEDLGNSITGLHLEIFELNGVNIVAEAKYSGKPYLRNQATNLMMEVFFWNWYESALAEEAFENNKRGPKPPKDTSNFALGAILIFITIIAAIVGVNKEN